ncbi:MAG TPA: membrane protein insertase YidC [Candidatus Xenobia bacterium]|nr:membrane protein insertase YidC [Candidatus Xenobia bacterium]
MEEFAPEKRLLIAFTLAIVVFLGWGAWMRYKYPPPPQPVSPEAPPVASSPDSSAPAPRLSEGKPAGPPAMPVGGVQAKEDTEERTFRIETDAATIELSNRGGVVRSWQLKKYRDPKGNPLELVQGGTTGLGWPLSFALANPEQEEKLNGALYVANQTAGALEAPMELVFEWSDGQVVARKQLRFARDGQCEIRTSIAATDNPIEHQLAWRGGFGEQAVAASGTTVVPAQVFVRAPDGVRRQLAQQAGETTGWLWKSPSPFPYTGEAAYAGMEDQYFAAVFLPARPHLTVKAWTGSWTPPSAPNEKEKDAVKIGAIAVGSQNGNSLRLYVGPKLIDALEQLEVPALSTGMPALADELVDYGWFWWIAKPLFWAMQAVHDRWVPNYGWVIVILTILINTALFPLKLRSMESAWKMQKVAPQVKAIQARYAQYKFNDPRKQQMQQEIMALYQQHGVNPFGGCLPMLLQIPFFFGFYKVLAISIQLRQAPWFGWIHDLSKHDPYYILPILMTITMYISTRLTPMTTADPVQAKMMRMMPLIFGFMFLWFSSGLVLYWMVSNVVGIGQQWFINKRQREREAAEKAARKQKKKKRPEETEE